VASTSALPISDSAVYKGETPLQGMLWATTQEELSNYEVVRASDEEIIAFFARHLAPLQISPEVAIRTMTHPMAAGSLENHSGKLISLGAISRC
jgi:hypothetical protein